MFGGLGVLGRTCGIELNGNHDTSTQDPVKTTTNPCIITQ